MEGVTSIEPPSIKNAMKSKHVLLHRQNFESSCTMGLLYMCYAQSSDRANPRIVLRKVQIRALRNNPRSNCSHNPRIAPNEVRKVWMKGDPRIARVIIILPYCRQVIRRSRTLRSTERKKLR